MELLCVVPDELTAAIDPQIASAAISTTQSTQNTTVSPAIASSIASFSKLSTRWIDYSGFDVMVVSLEKWKVLHDQNTAEWKAINGWLHNGGTLFVYDTGKRWENISEVERLTIGETSTTTDADEDLTKRGWELPKANLRDLAFNSIDLQTGSVKSSDEVTPIDRAPFIIRPCGLGLLATISSDQELGSKSNPYPWPWLFNTIGEQCWQWSQRGAFRCTSRTTISGIF